MDTINTTDLAVIDRADFVPADGTSAAIRATWHKAINRCGDLDAALKDCTVAITRARTTAYPGNRRDEQAALQRQHELNRAHTAAVGIANGLAKQLSTAVAARR